LTFAVDARRDGAFVGVGFQLTRKWRRDPLKSLKTDSGKAGLSDAIAGKPALRVSSETVITAPHYPVSKSRRSRRRPKNVSRVVLPGDGGVMSDAFQDRENTFEKRFAHDEDLRFKAVARRNRAVALWVAETKGLSGADAEKYASEFVNAQIGKSDADVEAALKADLARGNVDLSDHRLRKKMDEEMAAAVASVRAGK
jgi:hypothetical protein